MEFLLFISNEIFGTKRKANTVSWLKNKHVDCRLLCYLLKQLTWKGFFFTYLIYFQIRTSLIPEGEPWLEKVIPYEIDPGFSKF